MSTSVSESAERLLVVELWGLGDLALALPFLEAAAAKMRVTLLAKPHAASLLERFVPAVEHVALTAPWTAFRGKYQLHRWPWRQLANVRRDLRARNFAAGVSARPDPRDHALLKLSGARRRLGFARNGSITEPFSRVVLTDPVSAPPLHHRTQYWSQLANALGLTLLTPTAEPRAGRNAVIHTGAGQLVREWPRARFEEIATRLRQLGWSVTLLDDSLKDLPTLLNTLSGATRFIGNDSGPGHLAAALGVPTFTIFGPQLPELFSPQHPLAAWTEGKPCPYKPCYDACRYPEPYCIRNITVEEVWLQLQSWLTDIK